MRDSDELPASPLLYLLAALRAIDICLVEGLEAFLQRDAHSWKRHDEQDDFESAFHCLATLLILFILPILRS